MTVADDAEEGHRSVPAPGPNSLARCVCWERPLPIDVEMHTTAPPSALLRDARQFNLRGGWDVEHGDTACGVKSNLHRQHRVRVYCQNRSTSIRLSICQPTLADGYADRNPDEVVGLCQDLRGGNNVTLTIAHSEDMWLTRTNAGMVKVLTGTT